MTIEEAVLEISKATRILSGRGMKYISLIPDFDSRRFLEAVKIVSKSVSRHLTEDEMLALYVMIKSAKDSGKLNPRSAVVHLKRAIKDRLNEQIRDKTL